MKKLALALALAFGLSGCANVQKAIQTLQTTGSVVQGTVTMENLYYAENAAIVVFSGLNAYRSSCKQGLIPASCREVVARIQVYTRRIPSTLQALRTYVRTGNPGAVEAYNLVMNLINAAKGEAQKAGAI